MRLSLASIARVGHALLALAMVSAAAAVFLFHTTTGTGHLRQHAELGARLLVAGLESQLAEYQELAKGLARQAASQGLPGNRRPVDRIAFLEQTTAVNPHILRVRLLPTGWRQTDSAIPELSYACLDLLARRERGDKPVSTELHLPGTPSAHFDVSAPVVDPGQERLAGHLLLSIDPGVLRSAFAVIRPTDGYAELLQPVSQGEALVVASAGDPAFKTGAAPVQLPVTGSGWRVAYWPVAATPPPSIADLAIPAGLLGLALLLVIVALVLPHRTLRAAMRHDSEVMATLFQDIHAGLLMGQYPFRLAEFAALANRVRLTGERLIEDRRALEQRSSIDHLTGLATPLAFESRLDKLHQQTRIGFTSALLLADIDALEKLRDEIGDDAADRLLQQFARGLRAALRQSDFVARLDGGRFAVLFPMTDLDALKPVLERLRIQLAEDFDLGKAGARACSWSAGLTLMTTADAAPEDALRRVEAALQAARDEGGGHTVTRVPPA